MDPRGKLHQDVKRFLEVYGILSSEGRAQFEAQMAGSLKGQDQNTRDLYGALLQAAKDGQGIEEAIRKMEKVGRPPGP
jgi:hypothetical protein